ncbi:MAG: hypothetical protein EOP87_00260 [Verrucomicrobiaceae bacterium]|nr:MAG: hypothetical protein EOP87_00260 [Verrucomicrobiaceae bacterium]
MPDAYDIKLTIESFTGSTPEIQRKAIFTRWKTVREAVNSGVSSLSIPGLNGSMDPEKQADYADLLKQCLQYLDGVIGEDPAISGVEPIGHTVDFSCRYVNF